MKISWKWLNTLLPLEQKPDEVAYLLTDCGLEVESLEKSESVPGGLRGVVVGEIVEKTKHPDADKLSLTQVNVGSEQNLSIVCGAPNVAAGQKVLVALVGTKLHTHSGEIIEIKKSKIRGAVSEGMICAEDELGIGTSHDGIMVLSSDAVPGTPAAKYLQLEEDYVFEIGLTPNRGDAASHYGVARDLAAVMNCMNGNSNQKARLIGPQELPPVSGTLTTSINIQDENACRRYCGVTITGVEVKESPEWLKKFLNAIGVRPINNIVDITNFVLHETGQPLHAFDAFMIKDQQIHIKKCKEDTLFTTLDGVERKLSSEDLMICDSEKPLCLAGIFGGLDSGVTEKTSAIFLESAYFDASHIRNSSKKHGLKTDASFRFERGADPEMTLPALLRAANLILEIAGGTVASDVIDLYPAPITPVKIAFSYENCFSLMGKEIPKTEIKNILISLGIQILTEGNDGLVLEVPAFKTDVTREADITEEIMRIYGYNRIEESGKFSFALQEEDATAVVSEENAIGELLSHLGFHEIMNTSLSKSLYYNSSDIFSPDSSVNMVNPLSSDLNMLRRTLLFGGLETIAYNSNRKNQDVKLFEFGKTYSKNLSPENSFPYREEKHLALWMTGRMYRENPYNQNQKTDFFTLKSFVHALLEKSGNSKIKTAVVSNEIFSFSTEYRWKNQLLVSFGKIKKSILKNFDIKTDVYYADWNWDLFSKMSLENKIVFKEVPRFPGVRRDLALLLDKKVTYSQVEELAFASEKKLLKELTLFDIYEGEKIGNDKKSYAISFLLQDENATLNDQQIDKVMQKLIQAYEQKLGASLR
jgi:phenylalanyl-tRNA synthetase beta chain